MVVYIEYVLVDNIIIDYLLLKATFAITGNGYRRGWLLVSSFFGAVIALIFPLLSHLKILSIIIKILSGFLLTIIASSYPTKRAYFINTLIFFLLTFSVGGALSGIYNILGLDYSSEISIALIFLPVYLILRSVCSTIKYIYRRKHLENFIFSVLITLGEKNVTVRGFLDTGNGVYDGDSPVIFCQKKFFLDFIGDNLTKIKFKKINLNTVVGSSKNIAVELDQIKIYIKDQPNIFNRVTLCATNTVGDGYDLILHPAFYKENCDERVDQIKKVS